MLFDVEFNGHIIVTADNAEDACRRAEEIMDKSGAYVYIENAEVY